MSKHPAANSRKIGTAFYNWRLMRYAPWPLVLLIAGDVLYFKVDDANRRDYEARGDA